MGNRWIVRAGGVPIGTFFFLAAGIVSVTPAIADTRHEIQTQYARWSKAYMARDAETLIGILSPDYTLLDSSKKPISYDIFVAKLRLMKDLPTDSTKHSTELKRLFEHGDQADAVAVETMETPIDAKRSSFHRHEYMDTWIHYDAGWRLRRTITTKEWTVVAAKSK